MFDLGSASHLFIENLPREDFFFRVTLLRKFLHNLQRKSTLNHLNITIHNKNIPSDQPPASEKHVVLALECCFQCRIWLMANRTQIRSRHQPRYQGLLFSWLLKTRKFIWERNGAWIRLLIKNLVYFICLFLLLKQSNRITQRTQFFVVFAINEAIALHCFLFLFMLEQSLTSWAIVMKSTRENVLNLYLKTELNVRRKRSHKV